MQCYEWFQDFKEGRTSVSEDPGLDDLPQQQKTAMLKEFVRWFMEIVNWKSKKVAEEVDISVGSCHAILTGKLQMHSISAKFVPRLLTGKKRTKSFRKMLIFMFFRLLTSYINPRENSSIIEKTLSHYTNIQVTPISWFQNADSWLMAGWRGVYKFRFNELTATKATIYLQVEILMVERGSQNYHNSKWILWLENINTALN